MSLTPGRAIGVRPTAFEAQLAQRILVGTPNASEAAMTLFERCQPQTIGAAVGLVASHGRVTVDAFDRVADVWETYRHLKNLSWD